MAKAFAKLKTIRIAPRKVRLVADLIRGKKVSDARDILAFTSKGCSPIVGKLLESAVANAEDVASQKRERIDPDEMIISTILVNEGPTIHRFRPAARGRATRIRKRTCHIELEISDR